MRSPRRTTALLVALTLVVGAAGCGSDDDGDGSAETTTTTIVAPTETTSALVPDDVTAGEVTFHAVLSDGPCEDLEADATPADDAPTGGDTEEPAGSASTDLLPAADGFWCYQVGDLSRQAVGVTEADVVESSGTWTVTVRFAPEAVDSMNELFNACHEGTETCPAGEGEHGYVAVAVRGVVISAPSVAAPDLASDRLVIASGDLTEAEAQQLATALAG